MASVAASWTVEKLMKFLERLINEKFFGTISIAFQAGHVSSIKVEQTKKLEDL